MPPPEIRRRLRGSHVSGSSRILVGGQVQGVGYRFFTLAIARELGLRGWVRNLSDGRVEVVVAGVEPAALKDFLERLGEGPQGSRVGSVHVQEQADVVDPGSFEIRD